VIKQGVVLLMTAALLGCAGYSQWSNSHLHGDAAKRQFAIDNGYCKRAANGSAPMPIVRNYSSGQQTYRITGNYSGFNTRSGYNSGTYNATVTTYDPNAFSNGFAYGMNLGNAMAAMQANKEIYNGCMYDLGWYPSSY
jgi:hypothetical protein